MSRFGVTECERARVWAALAPDGELSELERRGLRSHLSGCRSCARFARGVERVSAMLRAEELARPSLPATVPHVVRRRGELVARVRPVAAAAAVALMALGIASRAPLEMDGRESGARTTAAPVGSQVREPDSLRALQQDARIQVGAEPLVRMMPIGRNQPV
jgi:predicted anti-sigma-YlaC factor YlaD